MANVPKHQRSPWIGMQRGREEKPEGGVGTHLLLLIFFAGLGALGVYILWPPYRIGGLINVARLLIKLGLSIACLWGCLVGIRLTLKQMRSGI
jgi:hypothetical protein